ncbi:SIR2 family protein [uncultured Dysosmobacter sp.]|uniref:SIR2 family protein n=1 Tax=uncultured Dysosmobacter sp. TaxID=2591384 RepID=UPI00262834BC|nr:SIR2 family protein [uncultured Dysosmobacter sp.]
MYFDSNFILEKINSRREDREQIASEEELLTLLDPEIDAGGKVVADTHIPTEELLTAFSELRLKLAEHMKLDDILFLFGNGASMYAGSKDTRDFKLSEYKDEYSDLATIIDKVGALNGIEEQLNALITANAYYQLVKDDKKNQLVTELIDKVKGALIESFVNSVDYRKLSLHEIFLLKLRTFDCLKRTSIYTPNYDLAFEYSLDKLGIEYKDGFSGFVNRNFNPRTLQGKDKTALIKIHGSVNWAVEEDKIKEFQPKFKDGKVDIDDTKPVLIYPTSHKLYQTYSTPYSELMRHMLDEAETGKNVIIILGYKYGDDHINEILIKALENPNNIFYFFLYNPDEEGSFIDQIKRLADSMPNINIMAGKVLADFKTFVKYILPATPEKTDQEKAIELLRKVLVSHAS